MPTPFSHPEHDHARCVRSALNRAELRCRQQGARLTAQRRRVLEIIWSSHEPVGAYAILEALAAEGVKPAPMTVYRALDFLQARGLVHRVAGINAFVGCSRPDDDHDGQFLLCRRCGRVAELHDAALAAAIRSSAAAAGFEVAHGRIELEGLCNHCAEEDE